MQSLSRKVEEQGIAVMRRGSTIMRHRALTVGTYVVARGGAAAAKRDALSLLWSWAPYSLSVAAKLAIYNHIYQYIDLIP